MAPKTPWDRFWETATATLGLAGLAAGVLIVLYGVFTLIR